MCQVPLGLSPPPGCSWFGGRPGCLNVNKRYKILNPWSPYSHNSLRAGKHGSHVVLSWRHVMGLQQSESNLTGRWKQRCGCVAGGQVTSQQGWGSVNGWETCCPCGGGWVTSCGGGWATASGEGWATSCAGWGSGCPCAGWGSGCPCVGWGSGCPCVGWGSGTCVGSGSGTCVGWATARTTSSLQDTQHGGMSDECGLTTNGLLRGRRAAGSSAGTSKKRKKASLGPGNAKTTWSPLHM